MEITFRTLGAWGSGKGTNLEPSEVDNNFWSIAQAIVTLQNNPALPTSISAISVSGMNMTITLTDGTVMGPFPLPVLAFHWRGDWVPSAPYLLLDVFSVPDTGIYLVIQPHTSGTSFDPNITVGGTPALQMLFGSTDASLEGLSDVQITSVSDGDVLYWNATDGKWENEQLGSMAYESRSAVSITGGTITGMPTPINPSDVATKSYADSAGGAGASAANLTMFANISGATAAMLPHTLSDYLDAVFATTVRGTLVFRGGSGWAALAPGSYGSFLETLGPGADPQWAATTPGVTALYAGTGIYLGSSGLISGTGTVSLAALPDGDLLANISGASAAPVPNTISDFLDHVITTARGTLLSRTSLGWVGVAPGIAGQYLKTQGTGADVMWDSPAGAGTVTSVAAGTGISTGGSPITGSGTISLAAIADGDVLANTSGSSAVPVPTALSLLWDHVFGSTQGAIVYRNATTWVLLTPGTSGQVLTSGGPTANISWAAAGAGLAPISSNQLLANLTGSSAVASGHSLSDILDAVISSSRGAMVFRGSGGWVALAPGTAGEVLTTGGPTSDPSWIAASAGDLAGLGDVAITSPADADILHFVNSTAKWTNVRPKYIFGVSAGGIPTASQNLIYHKAPIAFTIPANFGSFQGHNSVAGGSANTTASTVITVARALSASPTSFSSVGTITFAAGTITPTFASTGGTAISVAQGDVLRFTAPATPDATFADFYATIVGYET